MMPEDNVQEQEMPLDRKSAEMLLEKARHEADRGKYQLAVQHAREALEADLSYTDVRWFLAEIYEQVDEIAHASKEYQTLVKGDRANEAAWDALRRVDPDAAERLERLSNIAEDPFIRSKTALDPEEGLFAEMGEDAEEEFEEEDEETWDESAPSRDEIFVDANESSEEEDLATEPEAPAKVAKAPDGHVVWAFPGDYKLRKSLIARQGAAHILEKASDLAGDYSVWDSVMGVSSHVDKSGEPELCAMVSELADFFGVEMPRIFKTPERRMTPVLVGSAPISFALTTGMLGALSTNGLRFELARMMAMVAADEVKYQEASIAILERLPDNVTDVEEALARLMIQAGAGWDIGVSREDRLMTRQLAHSWQMRAMLSADRGGLYATGDLDEACLAIAKGAARDSDRAMKTTYESFVKEFDGTSPNELASVPEKSDPKRTAGYSAYRILMLRWWASTEEYRRLRRT